MGAGAAAATAGPNHPGSCLSHLQGPVCIDAWRYSVDDAVPAPAPRPLGPRSPYVLSTAREPPVLRCRGLADHRVPVRTNHLPERLSEIKGINRFKFHEGKVEEFKRLSAQAMDIVRAKDTGTLQYEIYFNEDQSECVVYERYRDSTAVIEHSAHVAHLNEAIFATGSVSSELLGEPSAELTAMIAGSGVPLFRPFLSM